MRDGFSKLDIARPAELEANISFAVYDSEVRGPTLFYAVRLL
jgi:hypothetical protein